MISVGEALDAIFALVEPLNTEDVPIRDAAGRVLAEPVVATRDQPPFAASAMDGYAVRADDALPGATLTVIGEAAAGHATDLSVGPEQAVRIFTGAPVPAGASRVVIQEDVTCDGDRIMLGNALDPQTYIRPAGADFHSGDRIEAPRRLDPATLTLAAAMNAGTICCTRRPEVALIATGDELVMPGSAPGPDQIIASNSLGLAAMVEGEGGIARILPIARDTSDALHSAFDLARGADLIVTIGGASVGDHDLVRQAAGERGLDTSFYKVAMRPGKPLMAGRLNGTPIIGLPGNPVSSMVCGHIFIRPTIQKMLGLSFGELPRQAATLVAPLSPNGSREHYMRAILSTNGIRAFDRQDSGLVSVLASANALIVRPPEDGAKDTGDTVDYICLDTRR